MRLRWGAAIGLFSISAATLVYEIALTRLLSLQQFHHFAFLVVSLAVMASAAGGVLLALVPGRRSPQILALGMAATLLIGSLVLNLVLFDSYSVAWDLRQWLALMVDLTAAAGPFLFGGWLVAAELARAGGRANRTYAVNLLGAATGCGLGLLVHAGWGTAGAGLAAVSLTLFAGACFGHGRSRRLLFAGSLGMLALMPVAARAVEMQLSPYKPLAIARLLPQARSSARAWGMGSQIDVIESTSLRSYPGLSLQAGPDLPAQAGVFLDGDGPVPLTLACPGAAAVTNLAEHLPSSLPALLRPGGRVLVLDAGGGLDVLGAVASGAGEVLASARSPEIGSLLLGAYRGPTCELAALPSVHWLQDPPRVALAQIAPGSVDVVLVSLSDPYRPVTAGAYSLHEDFLWTTEGLRAALRALKPNGILALNRWLSTPPAEEARALSMLLEAVGKGEAPEDHLLAYRGLRTATIMFSPAGWSELDRASAAAFLERNAFDPILFPGMAASEFNQFNRLPRDEYRQLFEALLRDPETVVGRYAYDLRPATDDRPFFFHFFRWQQLPDTLAGLGLTWQPFGGSGYLVLLGLLGCVGLLATLLTASPALSPQARRAPLRRHWAVYFGLIGGGFMLVEVALIQRLTLILVQPAVAVGVVVATLLLASGVGSALADRLPLRGSLGLLVLGLAVLAIALGPVLASLLRLASPFRQGLAALMLVPVGLLMGVPFSGGLIRLTGPAGGHIAWAWAINGAASGVAGVLAAVVSLEAGLAPTILLGAAAYGLASWVVPIAASRAAPP